MIGALLFAGVSAGCARQARGAPVHQAAQGAEGAAVEIARLKAQLAERDALVNRLETRLLLLQAEHKHLRDTLAAQQDPAGHDPAPSAPAVAPAHEEEEHASKRSARRPVLRLHGRDAPIDGEGTSSQRAAAGRPRELASVPPVHERLPLAPVPGRQLHAEAVPLTARADVDYLKALDLIRQREFSRALGALDAFLAAYPHEPRVHRVRFWRADMLFALSKYRLALAAFESLLREGLADEEAAAALLKVGLCHERLGAPERARSAIRQLKDQFPNSQAARLATKEGA